MMQLFLAKDHAGTVLYTYSHSRSQINYGFESCQLGGGEHNEHVSSFASLIRAHSTAGGAVGGAFAAQQAFAGEWCPVEQQFRASVQNQNQENTAGFKNANRLNTIASNNRESDLEMPGFTGQNNWTKYALPSQIDDISSIDGGNEFTNLNLGRGP